MTTAEAKPPALLHGKVVRWRERWVGPHALEAASDLLAAVAIASVSDGVTLRELGAELERPTQGVLEYVRCRLRLAVLRRRIEIERRDRETKRGLLKVHSAELRRWLWALCAPSGDPHIDLFRGSVELDVEEELDHIRALLSGLTQEEAAAFALPSLLESARGALHARYAFGAAPLGQKSRTQLLRHPASWALPSCILSAISWVFWPPGIHLAVAVPLIAAAALIATSRRDLLLAFVPRLGAAVAVGAAPLALTDEFWRLALTTSAPRAAAIAASLLTLSGVYLALEVRSRGVTRAARIITRTLELLTAAVAYAAVISHGIVAVVGPSAVAAYANTNDLPQLTACLAETSTTACVHWPVYVLFASASLTLGVLLQLLWEERPMTSRL